MAWNKGVNMDEYGCDSGIVWNILPDILLGDVVLSVYYWYYFQVVIFDMYSYWCSFFHWSLDQIKNLLVVYRPSQVVIPSGWFCVYIIRDNLDGIVPEISPVISK